MSGASSNGNAQPMSIDQIDECLRNARCFLECAKDVVGYQDEIFQVERLMTARLNVCVVNSALACELFLKAIAALESTGSLMPKGHRLDSLFEELTANSQQLVVGSCAGGDPVAFKRNLCEASNAFVEWRYSHEEPLAIHPLFLIELGGALNGLASILHP